jgi:hypothetical protein
MASNAPKDLQAKLNAEIATQQGIVSQLQAVPGSDPALIAHHQAALADLSAIGTSWTTERGKIQAQHATLGTAGIGRELARLAETIAPQIMQVAVKYRLTDFARQTFEVEETLNAIRAQVEDQIEKHKNNPRAKGDKMAYTAAAAELYLGWSPDSGQLHSQKVFTAMGVIEDNLKKLEWMRSNGLDITGDRMYVRGRSTLEMCRRATDDPGAFLWNRGLPVLKDFIDDMDARGIKGNQAKVDEIRRHFGMPLPTKSNTP